MLNSEMCDFLGYDFDVVDNYIKNWKPVKELEFLSSLPERRLIVPMDDAQKESFDIGYQTLCKKRSDINISYKEFAENKIIVNGCKRKLFKYLNDQELSEEIGKYKLPNKKLYAVISTNFDDFLMCSAFQSWTSCTDISCGDYKFTTISNIFTDGRFIIYITDLDERIYEGLQSYNMFFRAFGFVGEDNKLHSHIWYPTREYEDFKIGDIEVLKISEKTNSKYGINKVFNNFGHFTEPYIDYGCIAPDGKYSVTNDYIHFRPMTHFETGEIESTRQVFYYGEKSAEDSLKKHCDICGSKHGFIKTIGEKNYCPECLKTSTLKCSKCGKEINVKTANFTEDNKFLCDDCVTITYKRKPLVCDCGTLIKKKDEKNCKFCRNITYIDAFNNLDYNYYDKKSDNVRSYYRHFYVDEGLPPHLYEDEDIFNDYELYCLKEKK